MGHGREALRVVATPWSQPKPAFSSTRARRALTLVALAIVVGQILFVTAPLWQDLSKWGGHDWDMVTFFRYVAVKSIRQYHQFPFWNPYACGGYTSWGYSEGGTNVVSPWLPIYLGLPIGVAIRLEVVGTALLSALGTWLFAGRFTRSPGLRALACVVFAVNGRWAMQATTGHAMHLFYAWTPFVFFFFDRAIEAHCCKPSCEPKETTEDAQGTGGLEAGSSAGRAVISARRPLLDWLAGAIFVALFVYTGAIYPLPQTMVLLGAYAVLWCLELRSAKPLVSMLVIVAAGLGLAAPKLFPALVAFARHPRLFPSPEHMSISAAVKMLTATAQELRAHPVQVSHWGWHEWGIYVGWLPLGLFVLAFLADWSKRARPLKAAVAVAVVLGFGAFHQLAPWSLLHELPVFRSQHVPSRWLYPATLLFGVVIASAASSALDRLGRRRIFGEIAVLALGALVAADIGLEAREPLKSAFWMVMSPDLRPETASYHQERRVPPQLHYVRRDWAPPSLPAAIANVGTIECWAVVPMSNFAKSKRVPGQGAKGRGDAAYRGEAYSASGEGSATIVRWTPNQVDVRTEGMRPGDLLVLNQNFDPGWRANGEPALEYDEAVATAVSEPNGMVRFRYRSPYFGLGLLVCLLTLLSFGAARHLQARSPPSSFPDVLRRWLVRRGE